LYCLLESQKATNVDSVWTHKRIELKFGHVLFVTNSTKHQQACCAARPLPAASATCVDRDGPSLISRESSACVEIQTDAEVGFEPSRMAKGMPATRKTRSGPQQRGRRRGGTSRGEDEERTAVTVRKRRGRRLWGLGKTKGTDRSGCRPRGRLGAGVRRRQRSSDSGGRESAWFGDEDESNQFIPIRAATARLGFDPSTFQLSRDSAVLASNIQVSIPCSKRRIRICKHVLSRR
jgi:hypothetical protein